MADMAQAGFGRQYGTYRQAREWMRGSMSDDLRTAVRFPLHLPAVILADGRELPGVTVNISSGGILLRVAEPFAAEGGLEFLLEVPKEDIDSETSAAIHCVGHVIRSFEQDGFCFIAAVIDEYRFQ